MAPRSMQLPPEHRFRRTRPLAVVAAAAVVVIGILTGPFYLSPYAVVLAFSLFTSITLAQAWNLIGGYGGQFSLAHGMFVGVGAYTAGTVLIHTSAPLALAIGLSGLCAGAIAALAGLLLFRLRGHYLVMGSLGMALAAQAWMINWSYTGGTSGLTLPDRAILDFTAQYYLAAGLLIVAILCIGLLVHSRFGLRLMAIRDHEDAAAELGVGGMAVKLGAFVLSACIVGLTGALIACQQISIEPVSAFGLSWTISMIIMTVVGGSSTLMGPIIGAVVLFAMQQQFQDYESWSTLITGVALVLIVVVAPGGLWGALRAAARMLRQVGPLSRRGLR
jgi:branched-chain amino acid transport system permease protein